MLVSVDLGGVDFADHAVIDAVERSSGEGRFGSFVCVRFLNMMATTISISLGGVLRGNIRQGLAGADLLLESLIAAHCLNILKAGSCAVLDAYAGHGTRAHGPFLSRVAVALEGFGSAADVALFDRCGRFRHV